jgi:hypothetical protein
MDLREENWPAVRAAVAATQRQRRLDGLQEVVNKLVGVLVSLKEADDIGAKVQVIATTCEALEALSEVDPEYTLDYLGRSLEKLSEGKPAAEQVLELLIGKHSERGTSFSRGQDWTGAEKEYRRLTTLDPQNRGFQRRYGAILWTLGDIAAKEQEKKTYFSNALAAFRLAKDRSTTDEQLLDVANDRAQVEARMELVARHVEARELRVLPARAALRILIVAAFR